MCGGFFLLYQGVKVFGYFSVIFNIIYNDEKLGEEREGGSFLYEVQEFCIDVSSYVEYFVFRKFVSFVNIDGYVVENDFFEGFVSKLKDITFYFIIFYVIMIIYVGIINVCFGIFFFWCLEFISFCFF